MEQTEAEILAETGRCCEIEITREMLGHLSDVDMRTYDSDREKLEAIGKIVSIVLSSGKCRTVVKSVRAEGEVWPVRQRLE